MHVIAELSIVPVGRGTSISDYVAACKRVLDESGLKSEVHASGTEIEGGWDEVFAAIRACHEVVHGLGVKRIVTTIKVDSDTGRPHHLEESVRSVSEKLHA